jgi:hypothetical protein
MAQKKNVLPPNASGAIRPEIYKDPRTGLCLAQGARQNWPSSGDNECIEREYRSLRVFLNKSKEKVGPSVGLSSSV